VDPVVIPIVITYKSVNVGPYSIVAASGSTDGAAAELKENSAGLHEGRETATELRRTFDSLRLY
jgi:hypothetical protein